MSAWNDDQIFAFWNANYSPTYVQAKGGVPMTATDAANSARYFGGTDGWRVQGLWKTWVLTHHAADLTAAQRLLLGLSDLSQGNIGATAQDAAAAGNQFLNQAEALAESVGRDLAAEAQDVSDQIGKTARDIANNSADAFNAFLTGAKNLDPAHILKVIQDNFAAVRAQIDKAFRDNFAVVKYNGQSYAWDEARKSPESMVWYIAAASLADANKVKKMLIDDLKALTGIQINAADEDWPFRLQEVDRSVFGIEPITITLIIIAVIVVASIIIAKVSAPKTIAHQVSEKILDAASKQLGVNLPGSSGDPGSKPKVPGGPNSPGTPPTVPPESTRVKPVIPLEAAIAILVLVFIALIYPDWIGY